MICDLLVLTQRILLYLSFETVVYWRRLCPYQCRTLIEIQDGDFVEMMFAQIPMVPKIIIQAMQYDIKEN